MYIQKTQRQGYIDRLLVPSPTLPPATTTNCWRIYSQTEKIRILIDPAAVQSMIQQELLDGLPDTIEWIFLTHHHHDHIGSATLIREKKGVKIATSQETADRLSFDVDHILSHNDIIEIEDHVVFAKQENQTPHSLRVLLTPGHAPGHICFQHLKELWIVCGDMLAGEGTILLAPPEGNLEEYFASLLLLQSKEPSSLCPAHGPSLTQHHIQEYIDHRMLRNEQILSHLSIDIPLQPIDIAKKIYTLPEHFYSIAAQQVLCHLQYLEKNQKVKLQGSSFVRI